MGPADPGEDFVVGAHYDSVYGSPGANDNATGVAALLEIGSLVERMDPRATLALSRSSMKSLPYSRRTIWEAGCTLAGAGSAARNIPAMYSLETIGC
jgi:hypothetical protein